MLLKKIQNYIKQYVEVIANVLQCEVEIVDENLIRIAGTGYFEKNIEKKCEGLVYSFIFKTEKSQVIEDPRKNNLCIKCKDKEICTEELEISAPIFYKGKIVGVIGLVCFKKEDKERLIRNMNSYLKFTEQISDLISSKLFETEEEIDKRERVDILKNIINNYDKGLIILNENREIIDINSSAIEKLKIEENLEYSIKKVNLISKREKLDNEQVYILEIEGNRLNVQGKLFKLKSFMNKEYEIFLFDKIRKNRLKEMKEKDIEDVRTDIFNIIGNSKKIEEVRKMIKKIANSPSTILITGESGTGKELVAKAIHSCSDRVNDPFVAINCGAIPETLLESELFGYVRGAFSGASGEGRIGKFELANNGIIFLDEIGEMPLSLQVKLLRVLQERKIEKLGSNKSIDLNIRVIAATNADLLSLIEQGKFRKDLYYRLNVLEIELPPLRERKEDIEILLESLIKKYSLSFNKSLLKVDSNLLKILKNYNWPGNIRELENIIEYLVNMQDEFGNLDNEVVVKIEEKLNKKQKTIERVSFKVNNTLTLEAVEKEMIKESLKKYGTSREGKEMCAKELGIGIATLYRKIEKFKL